MPDLPPAALAGRPLFEPVAGLLRGFAALPSAEDMNALAAGRGVHTAGSVPLSFVPPADDGLGYEARIALCGQVAHRPDNWHDFFNALAWLVFPKAKAALSARHGEQLALGQQLARGPVRDALTQFDECGVVVVSGDPELSGLLQSHQWHEAFWIRRKELRSGLRYFIFGHALYDHLRAPYVGLCGKALYLDVAPEWLAREEGAQIEEVDARVADWLTCGLQTPRDLKPLPLLGIPGVVPESEAEAYYRDQRQFRPLRAPNRGRVIRQTA